MKSLIAILSAAIVTVLGWVGAAPAIANEYSSPAPAGAEAYIISPEDGAEVSSPFTVRFGLSGMGVAPAGIDKPKTGHHHLLVDLETLPDLDEALAATDHIKHFGGGQTQTTLDLPAGTHKLQLLLGNYVHIPHEPPVMSEPITVLVK